MLMDRITRLFYRNVPHKHEWRKPLFLVCSQFPGPPTDTLTCQKCGKVTTQRDLESGELAEINGVSWVAILKGGEK